ncbi:SusC/RagA family TonB-linked outer membrane protein [Alistipes senegalensis]|uniref:SusC/RagA family TonB-linked outer membrane protein n=1 Tax=Alistipes senegalensis TaxID=1288121 RepID=UPI0024311242|nr:TonB-dependent receptor [Alistipes senegalensis]MCI7307791.1 TonB-dependent receptor [Alistipes senegalensis]MDD7038757.1 TonB-dependent receptor [Alistipes senegalensis]MDY2876149.1 TonB-dependent receptor [Alistipes senegalensis]MDY4569894.1 TonB-dependent receptor [Alistipes senegalensis]
MNENLHGRAVLPGLRRMLLALVGTLFLLPGSAQSQSTVSGIVTDASGEGIAGVAVIVKGTTTGTSTDMKGAYTIRASKSDVLVFSFLGYKTQEVAVHNRMEIDVRLESDAQLVDEVVVVGYGVQKKSLVTGAISSVKGSALETTGIMRADDALAGKTAGVQVVSNSGQPGSDVQIYIRGIGTNGTATPIYIVDGMAVSGIEYLNPGDIESIEVLKDAAASAIYGARGGNGVVLITTRRSKDGQWSVNYDFSYGIQNIARKIDVLNAREYAIIQNEAAANSGATLPFTDEQIASFRQGTDWQEAILNRNAGVQRHNVRVSAGTARSSFNGSASYLNQDGILAEGKSNFKRYTINLAAEHKLLRNDALTVGENVVVSHVKKQSVTQNSSTAGPLVGALNMDPLTPVYDPYQTDELYGGFGVSKYVSQEVVNPVARIYYSNGRTLYTTMKGSVFAELKFLNDFRLRGSAGADITWTDGFGYSPMYKLNSTTGNTSANGASQSYDQNRRFSYEGYLTWGHVYDGRHDVSAMIGASLLQRSSLSLSASRNDLKIDDEDHAYISMATNSSASASGGPGNPSAIVSFFGRVNYAYDNRYMLTATVRRDGSSRFGPNNRFGTFPSVSVGWNVANESFLRDVRWLDALKFRASWGQNGNENIGDFAYLATISTYGLGYSFGSQNANGSLAVGAAPVKVVNPDLKWETSEQTDIGLDVRFFGCLGLTFDYYVKKTKDLLVTTPVPLMLGNSFPTANAGNVKNSGVEFAVDFQRQFGKWNIAVNGNISYNKNRVTYVGTDTGYVTGSTVQGITGAVTRMEAGHAMSYFWGYKTLGIFQNQAEIDAWVNSKGVQIQPDARPGDFRYQDTDDNGTIDDNDRVDLGNPFPKVTFGLNVNVSAYGFDLGITSAGQAGNKIFSVLRRPDLTMSNYGAWVLDRWHGEGTSNSIPRVAHNDTNLNWTRPSDFYLRDGDFWRIRNITLGYTVNIPEKYYLRKVRVFASVDNAFTFTKYDGYDPEVGNGGSILGSGIDRGVYPRPRTVSVGLNLTF